ncbi:MAG TPA: hypothetical protein V6C76_09675 [Drouetiella sp.]
MNKLVMSSLAALIGIASTFAPAFADDSKPELIQLIRQNDGVFESMASDKLVSFNMSPEWWQYFLNKDTNAYHNVRCLADSLMVFGQNMGGEDISQLDTTHDGTSPLIGDALNKLAPNAHLTIVFLEPVKDDKFRKQVMENLSLLGAPIGEKFCCNPRGKKLHITVTLDTKARALSCAVSKDGNEYHFVIPAYTSYGTTTVEEQFKKGT